MFTLRKSVVDLPARLRKATSLVSVESYIAVNDPVLDYEPGSKERVDLEKKLKEMGSKTHDIPIIVGDEEIRTKDVRYQLKPFEHKSRLAKFYSADAATLQKAIDVGQKAFRAWDATPLEKRGEIFIRAAELIRGKYRADMNAATMLGQGKTVIQAEIDSACELSDFYAFNVQWALDAQKWQPLSVGKAKNKIIFRGMEGFWAAVAPFNFTAISGHLAGAPAFMGNVVLWKPASTAILSSYTAYKILREAGLPPGVINFVPADGSTFGPAITKSPLFAGVNFTGSTGTFEQLWLEIAKNLPSYKSYPRLIGECGGKNFHLIHSSASNTQHIVNCTLRSAFEYQGQKCSACSRMYVAESRWKDIRQGLQEGIKKMKVGSPLDFDTFMTAVIDAKSYKNIKSYIDYAKSKGLEFVAGGQCDDSVGYYIQPTIIEVKDPEDKLIQEEIFGPVLAVYVYRDADYSKVLGLVDKATAYALTGSVFAEDENVIRQSTEALRFSTGNFYVNDKSTGSVVSQQPFGGARKSGTNDKAGSPNYIMRFTNMQAIKTTDESLTDYTYPYMKK